MIFDPLSPEQRSKQMALVKSKDTKPEMKVRRLLFALGFRYTLHVKDLPGVPDIVFTKRNKVIFVHGCFWHGHISENCRLARMPKSRQEYWVAKIAKNKQRDQLSANKLLDTGWKVLILWECELRNLDELTGKLLEFMAD